MLSESDGGATEGEPKHHEDLSQYKLNQSDWPAADRSHGITSAEDMDEAEAAGRAIEVGSNFFLFFSSQLDPHPHH